VSFGWSGPDAQDLRQQRPAHIFFFFNNGTGESRGGPASGGLRRVRTGRGRSPFPPASRKNHRPAGGPGPWVPPGNTTPPCVGGKDRTRGPPPHPPPMLFVATTRNPPTTRSPAPPRPAGVPEATVSTPSAGTRSTMSTRAVTIATVTALRRNFGDLPPGHRRLRTSLTPGAGATETTRTRATHDQRHARIVFSPRAEKVRDFFADVIGRPSVRGGGGWGLAPIFACAR